MKKSRGLKDVALDLPTPFYPGYSPRFVILQRAAPAAPKDISFPELLIAYTTAQDKIEKRER